MAQIEVRNLTKVFTTKIATDRPGWFGIARKTTKSVKAVDGITFDVDKGETLAFIGPNGAGKSTTIKMLTGILYPTSGSVSIIGINPWKERQRLAFRIGTVFGQKSQLSFHLPAEDSFKLFAKIYELDDQVFRRRVGELVEIFDAKDYIKQPLRKLSLGQRMRCEIIASLLHNPEIVFLDEPTIGLDVVAKQELRKVLRKLNENYNTTIFLTSHDTGDIDAISDRTIIINGGKIVFDDSTNNLKRKYIKTKRIKVRFTSAIRDIETQNVHISRSDHYETELEVNTAERTIKSVLEEIVGKYDIADISIEDPSLDEIIASIYEHNT